MAILRTSLFSFAPPVGPMYRDQLGYYSPFGRNVGYANVSIREIIAEAGDFELSGQNASLLKSFKITGANGDFLISGQNAGVIVDRLIVCDSFNLAVNGMDSNILANRVIFGQDASFNLSLIDANLFFNRLLSAANGAYEVSFTDGELILTITDKGYDVEMILQIAREFSFSLSIGREHTFRMYK